MSVQLPPMLHLSTPSRSEMGQLGERYAVILFERNGYIPLPKRYKHGDLGVIDPATGQTFNVEVKASRRRPDGKWVFLLKNQRVDYRHADYVLLLATLKSGFPVCFLIPTSEIDCRSTIVITSDPRKYAGRWSKYRTAELRLA